MFSRIVRPYDCQWDMRVEVVGPRCRRVFDSTAMVKIVGAGTLLDR
jgi:hypothetical protein